MELGIETKVTGMILEKGVVALDARLFSEIIENFPTTMSPLRRTTN